MNIFNLRHELTGSITDIPLPEKIVLSLCGQRLYAGLDETVMAGQHIARSDRPGYGDLHSPVYGTIKKIDADSVTIRTLPGRTLPGKTLRDQEWMAPIEPDESDTQRLADDLNTLGIDTFDLHPAQTLIINGLNPEPGVTAFQRILAERRQPLLEGLAYATQLVQPGRIFVAVPEGSQRTLGPCDPLHIRPVYPNSLPQLVAKAATGSESMDDVVVLGVDRLLDMGRVRMRGLPATVRAITVQGMDYRVHIGTPAKDLLAHAGIAPVPGDKIVFGGPMRGQAQMSPDAPVQNDTYAVSLFAREEFLLFQDNPCCNCGECDRICPARIPVALMTRSCEFGKYSMALQYDIDACFECGMCAYVCPMQRPLVQYIRLGKSELAQSVAV
ncbi:MAG: hypothetical protein ACNI3A_18205 [Desulfovibrio sp.]|uniref:hypothetical protein n=1 Tax=Desulfovibrio sp. 7SRBS1 TaxID=3378064 RepID=UPI003B3CA6F5